jgi:hypothetical protein
MADHISDLRGVPYITRAVKVVADFGELIEDGLDKPSPLELAGLLPQLVTLAPVVFDLVTHSRELAEEFADLSETESTELRELFAEEFDLENDSVEQIVERAVVAIDRLYDAFVGVRDLYRAIG